ncbi:tetraacyldisaccharide 4'-kinase [Rhodovibrio salinarum]|uniref:Tetraacyldisaccharide 4'-kinase n=1 Tax=Rhodovibrio salinarum TaxID=1087 RepID=A0A934V0T5_9PROT|nr:tetraacyldisaccharide 4'-kinase [Rhodovibrio salinarum]MBK1698652.1 tetraacyldisaccharide 4'-kinase [Rhodovibrio salinarum]
MREPAFWTRDGVTARLLSPLGALYDVLGQRRAAGIEPVDCGVPVICVGNATSGGTGKTPVVIDLARRLQIRGVLVHLLTRGYKGRETGPHAVNPMSDTAAQVGDEPLLLARAAPTWVARDRAAGARAAVAEGAQAILMDDGLQNPTLQRDLNVLVVDGARGFGNGRVIPAGPLRARLDRTLASVHACVITGADRTNVLHQLPAGLPVAHAETEVDPITRNRLAGTRVIAFCGIGRPEKFYDTLRALGSEVVETRSFADHHRYRPSEITGVLEMAKRGGLTPVTTEKDVVRLPAWAQARVEVVPITLNWQGDAAIDQLLGQAVPHTGPA